jgi:hypothetical protein
MKINIFLFISRPFLLRMRNISDKRCRENQNTHFVFSSVFENHSVYEIKWENIVDQSRAQMTVWIMRIACWITKAINTHTRYVILSALPLHQRLHERA